VICSHHFFTGTGDVMFLAASLTLSGDGFATPDLSAEVLSKLRKKSFTCGDA